MRYARTASFRAPAELAKVHALGKTPVIEIKQAESTQVIAELGHIFQYLLKNHNVSGKLVPSSVHDEERVNYFIHYAEGTLQPLLTSLVVNYMASAKAPWLFGRLTSLVTDKLNSLYYVAELYTNLDYLEQLMREQHAQGSEYFVGHALTGADIMLSFPVWQILFQDPSSAQKRIGPVDLNAKYPHLKQWSDMILAIDTVQELLHSD